ncbi:alpha/beta hydrolase family esterase [Nocardia paucivorans]|uniref:alpha/beta hydrolase family esterase n=1 Tax=Nocardia paucivorans TaxID=114259 RepID=UPI0002F62313|nr:alpha/beta fold hydrolase [Nocardia paucivorans]
MISLHTVHADGRNRTYTLVPATDPEPPTPLLLVFHGSNQNGATVRTMSGLDALTDHFHVAYLDGYRGGWNDGRPTTPTAATRENIDDIAFTRTVINDIRTRMPIDQVYAAGYSQGGQLVLRIAREAPELLAGAALFSAAQPVPTPLPEPSPMPFVLFHGTKDRLVPYNGGTASLWGFRPRGEGMSAPDTAAYLARRNGITTTPVTTRTETRMPIVRTDYRQDGKPPVTLFTVEGGGHVIPGRGKAPFVLGRIARNLDAATELTTFLLRSRRP